MICRDDLELRWRLLGCENEFSNIIILFSRKGISITVVPTGVFSGETIMRASRALEEPCPLLATSNALNSETETD